MKHLYLFLFFSFSTSFLVAQDCNFEAFATDINCTDNGDGTASISFDLTLLEDGTPVETASSESFFVFDTEDNFVFGIDVNFETLSRFPVTETVSSGVTCSNIVDNNLILDVGSACEVGISFIEECHIDFSITRVECTDTPAPGEPNLTLNLSMTEFGLPAQINTSRSLSFNLPDNPLDFVNLGIPNNEAITVPATNLNYEGILNGDLTCADIIDNDLELRNGPSQYISDICMSEYDDAGDLINAGVTAFFAAPAEGIPTMGEWGLIILFLLMMIVSVRIMVLSKNRETT